MHMHIQREREGKTHAPCDVALLVPLHLPAGRRVEFVGEELRDAGEEGEEGRVSQSLHLFVACDCVGIGEGVGMCVCAV